MKKAAIHLFSWIVVLGIVLYLLHSIVPADDPRPFVQKIIAALGSLMQALLKARYGYVLLLLALYLVYITLSECLGISWIIRRFHQPVTLLQMVPARVVTFLIAVFNYQAGQAGLLFYLKRIHQVPMIEATSSIFFLALMDFFVILLFGTIGAFFLPDANLRNQILWMGIIGLTGYVGHAFFWRASRLGAKLFFRTFQQASLKDYVTAFLVRLPIHLGIVAGFYVLFACFHVPMSFKKMFVYIPIMMVISNIPMINVGMVGASQASLVYFFREDAPEDTLLALSLVWALGLNLMKVIVGGLFLTRYSKKLFSRG